LKQVPQGKFILMVTHPTYADYFDPIELLDSEGKGLGQVAMTLKSRLLEEVFVRQQIAAIRMKVIPLNLKQTALKLEKARQLKKC
jgi:hypothetical protein